SEDEPTGVMKRRKIYFCSRTHSQLSQVMSELDKIIKKSKEDIVDYTAVTLGSRTNLCINKEVTRIQSVNLMNEKCLDLQKSDTKCCPYYNEDKEPSLKLLEDSIKRLQVADIEDMHNLGKKVNA